LSRNHVKNELPRLHLRRTIWLILRKCEKLKHRRKDKELGTPLETWFLGAILTIVGLLVTACGFGKNELGISFTLAGLTSAGVGSFIFVAKFKQWIEHL